MKKIIPILLLVSLFSFITPSNATAQGGAEITFFHVGVTPGPFFPGPSYGSITLGLSVNGGATKAVEVIINGEVNWFPVSGDRTLEMDLVLPSTVAALEVTVNCYTSPVPGRGNLSYTDTRRVDIPL